MSLTPSTIRLDLKCGNGSISPGEKCTKGSATQAEQAPRRGGQTSGGNMQGGRKPRGLKTAAKLVGAAALIGGAAYMQQTARRNTLERRSIANPLSAAGVAFKAQTLQKNISPKAVRNIRERATMNAVARRWAKKVRKPKNDSVWAEGF